MWIMFVLMATISSGDAALAAYSEDGGKTMHEFASKAECEKAADVARAKLEANPPQNAVFAVRCQQKTPDPKKQA